MIFQVCLLFHIVVFCFLLQDFLMLYVEIFGRFLCSDLVFLCPMVFSPPFIVASNTVYLVG